MLDIKDDIILTVEELELLLKKITNKDDNDTKELINYIVKIRNIYTEWKLDDIKFKTTNAECIFTDKYNNKFVSIIVLRL